MGVHWDTGAICRNNGQPHDAVDCYGGLDEETGISALYTYVDDSEYWSVATDFLTNSSNEQNTKVMLLCAQAGVVDVACPTGDTCASDGTVNVYPTDCSDSDAYWFGEQLDLPSGMDWPF